MEPDELEASGELVYWKRRVAQSCVYGVDANPLAVDLAKLSLWLATVARDRPLSFLDHHLRCGNSLVGACLAGLGPGGDKKRKKARAEDAAQLSMLGDDAFRRSVMNAVDSIWLIEGSPADTLEDVREQERLSWKTSPPSAPTPSSKRSESVAPGEKAASRQAPYATSRAATTRWPGRYVRRDLRPRASNAGSRIS